MKSIYLKRLSERYKHLTAKIVNHSTLFFKYFETTYYVALWWESGKCSSDRNIAVRDTHRFDSRAVSSDRNVAARDTQVRVSGRTTRAPPLSCIYLIIVMLIFNIFYIFLIWYSSKVRKDLVNNKTHFRKKLVIAWVSLFEGPGQQLAAVSTETGHCVCIIIRRTWPTTRRHFERNWSLFVYHYLKGPGQQLDSISKETGHCVCIIIRRTWSTTRRHFDKTWSLFMYQYSKGPGQPLDAISKETDHCLSIIIRKDLVNN